MHAFLPLLAILGALSAGVVSPGPSFVMVARVAVAQSRANGVLVALGMGAGGFLFAAAALAGLQAVLLAVPTLYLVLRVVGGLYLAYLGLRIYRSARQPLAITAGTAAEGSRWRHFWIGLSTQVSNPKTAIVYASVFAAFLPATFSPGFAAALLVIVFGIESGWYMLVALVLSAKGPRGAYVRAKKWLDRLAGGVMMALGAKLVASAWAPGNGA
jgi:threonine/homoserine/homoserine lactone efflux protein